MNGPEHYRAAERLLTQADRNVSANWQAETGEFKSDLLAAAQVHATLALTAAYVSSNLSTEYATDNKPLVQRPFRGDDFDPPFPGNTWGRALYSEEAAS